MKLSKVKDHPHLYRDEETGAIINYDTASYNQRLKKIENQKSHKKELDDRDKKLINYLIKHFIFPSIFY